MQSQLMGTATMPKFGEVWTVGKPSVTAGVVNTLKPKKKQSHIKSRLKNLKQSKRPELSRASAEGRSPGSDDGRPEREKLKKYRDMDGKLTMSLEQIKKETATEAAKYYRVSGLYFNFADFREYVYIGICESLAHFQSFDGYNLFIPIDRLGTFLPDVASDGMELVAFEE